MRVVRRGRYLNVLAGRLRSETRHMGYHASLLHLNRFRIVIQITGQGNGGENVHIALAVGDERILVWNGLRPWRADLQNI